MASVLTAKEDPFKLYGGDQSRAFYHVDDAVEAMTQLMDFGDAIGKIVDIGNDAEEIAIGDLVKLILHLAGHEPAVEWLLASRGSVPRRCPNLTMLRKLTGCEPTALLEDGVRGTLEWYRRAANAGPLDA